MTAIDLLFVDGPPATKIDDIRKSALPFFWDRMTNTGKVVLDDAGRKGEIRMIKEWKLLYPSAAFMELEAEKGAFVITKQ